MADKVKYGIKNVHYALLTNDTPTYETPVPIPGAVSFSLEASGDTTPYYADDMQYFVTVANNGYTGDLEMALFPDKFLEDVFGFTASTKDKVITENATVQPKQFALLFEEEGDVSGTKYVLYNCTCTRPSRSLATTTETTEPQNQTVSVTASPLADGRTMAYTSGETPENVTNAWYENVWLADSVGD
ncbi:phage tail protein [Massilimaliae timonensis]|jgi:phi13 family phage major tail protein|uniref:Phage tail protein n=1 Tax=Massiliimalia timonensis TaxID=1987501 RepID=A0A8J6P949_9FIRM|nr:major tail protein [Massiliimalia timonensis]MBC8612075.1 phage tail protein [Massiliimalia timonensis]DAV20402.1 MAG TPA: tail tube protein [Caudoviricetes sp.]